MNWTEKEYLNYMANRQDVSHETEQADEGPESKLSCKIRAFCKDRAWPCFIIPQSEKLKIFLTPDWPDGTIVIPLQKRVIFLELKSKTGKRTEGQKQMAYIFGLAGYPIHKVKSFARFLEIIE